MGRGTGESADDGLTALQRWCLVGGGVTVATACSAILARPDTSLLRWVKTGAGLLPFAVAKVAPKHHREMRWMVAAMGFSGAGNFFLSRAHRNPGGPDRLVGIGMFGLAYVLVAAGMRGGKFRASDLVFLAPYVAAGSGILRLLWPGLRGVMRVGAPAFTAAIVAMAWTTAVMPRRGVFSEDVARWSAAAGAVLMASDAAVGLAMFNPPPAKARVWLDLFVWVTYLGGWLLFLLGVVDPIPRRPLATEA